MQVVRCGEEAAHRGADSEEREVIAGGQFTVASGETKDLNIDFNACASLVVQKGQYRLKPVLHAGEVTLQSASTAISGTIIDNVTQQAIAGGNTVVALEQNVNGIDRVIMETVPNSAGGFSFCPVLAGTYDLVATAIQWRPWGGRR